MRKYLSKYTLDKEINPLKFIKKLYIDKNFMVCYIEYMKTFSRIECKGVIIC